MKQRAIEQEHTIIDLGQVKFGVLPMDFMIGARTRGRRDVPGYPGSGVNVFVEPATVVECINAMVAFLEEHDPDRLEEWEKKIYSTIVNRGGHMGDGDTAVGVVTETIAHLHNEAEGG